MSGLKIFVIFTVIWSVLLAGVNFIVDPLQIYRRDDHPVFFKTMRYQIPGLVKHYDYDTILVGTSHSANFRPSDLDASMGSKSLNLSVNSSSGWEQNKIVSLALSTRSLTNVIWEMNYRTFDMNPTERIGSGVFPLYFYETSPATHFYYLYSLDGLRQSWKRLTRQGHKDIETINSWEARYAHLFDGKHIKEHYCTRVNENRRPGHYLGYEGALDTYLVKLAASHRETLFSVFLPPLSYLNYLLPNELAEFVRFRQLVFETAKSHENIIVLDFNSRFDWIGDPMNYKDIEHYSADISREMLLIASKKRDYVANWNVWEMNAGFVEFLRKKRLSEPACAFKLDATANAQL
jgi:hypothetical protein